MNRHFFILLIIFTLSTSLFAQRYKVSIVNGLKQTNVKEIEGLTTNIDLPNFIYGVGLDYELHVGHGSWFLNYIYYPETSGNINDSTKITLSGFEFNFDFHLLHLAKPLGSDIIPSTKFSLFPLIGLTAGKFYIKDLNDHVLDDFFVLTSISLNSRNYFNNDSSSNKKINFIWGFNLKYSFDITNSYWKNNDLNLKFKGNKYHGFYGGVILGVAI